MKAVKVYREYKSTSYYFLNYSDKEISDYMENNPPKTGLGTYSTYIIRFSDKVVWDRFWRALEMLKREMK